jgi:hypothetical protein
MIMSMVKEFWVLVKKAETVWEEADGVDELEPYLLEILRFVNSNIDSRNELVECFNLIVKEDRGPIEVLEFCMRELRWEEVRETVMQEMKSNSDIRVLDALERVLAVFEDEWADSDLYAYYS